MPRPRQLGWGLWVSVCPPFRARRYFSFSISAMAAAGLRTFAPAMK